MSVFCAVAHAYNTDLTFYIDGKLDSVFNQAIDSDGSTAFDYQVSVYESDFLPFGPHTLTIVNGLDGVSSLMLLDYIMIG